MPAARDLLTTYYLKVVPAILIVLGVAITGSAHAEPGYGTAPLNVPGRYVSGGQITTGTVQGRYVTGPQPTQNTTPASSPALGRYVNIDGSAATVAMRGGPGRATQSADGPALATLSQVKLALADIGKLYGSRIHEDDTAALRAFYDNRYGPPLWVDGTGLTANAKAVVTEIADADNWGLSARAFRLPGSLGKSATAQERAQAELLVSASVLKYVRHARGGRTNPPSLSRLYDQRPELLDPLEVLPQIGTSREPDAYLRKQHPAHPQFVLLRKALLALQTVKKKAPARGAGAEPDKVRLPASGPTLRLGTAHADVAQLRKRLKVPAQGGQSNEFDAKLQAALVKFQVANGLSADGVVGPRTRRTLNGEPVRKPSSNRARVQKIVLNMERWRWMPRSPGAFYVFNNIPEFRTRIYKDGRTIYSEKIIVGKNKNPTPVFSADMHLVVFHPSWSVPNGIKRTEILPFLKQSSGFFGFGGADTRILKAHNLTVSQNGRRIDASKVDWSKVDIRRYNFTQAPSSTNVLGKVKFRFPNRHDVYMHDTPERHLFKKASRALSHGCMRVQKPLRLAELILEHDKAWTREKVGGYWRRGGSVKLDSPIPVHTGYITAFVDENGRLRTFGDLYGLDGRVARALGKQPLHVEPDAVAEASNDGGRDPTDRPKKKRKRKKKPVEPPTVAELIMNALTP